MRIYMYLDPRTGGKQDAKGKTACSRYGAGADAGGCGERRRGG